MEPLTASDGFAIMMIAMMAVAMSMIASLWFCMRANVARRDSKVDELIEEVAEQEDGRSQVPAEEPPPAQAWERDGDWWKK